MRHTLSLVGALAVLTACAADPLEAALTVSEPEVQPSEWRGALALSGGGPIEAGYTAELHVTGAYPGERIFLARGRSGDPGPCLDVLGGACLPIDGGVRVVAEATADERGALTFAHVVPWRSSATFHLVAVAVRGFEGRDSQIAGPVVVDIIERRPTPFPDDIDPFEDAHATFFGLPDDGIGRGAMKPVGDLDGDGTDDVLFGAVDDDTLYIALGPSEGTVRLADTAHFTVAATLGTAANRSTFVVGAFPDCRLVHGQRVWNGDAGRHSGAVTVFEVPTEGGSVAGDSGTTLLEGDTDYLYLGSLVAPSDRPDVAMLAGTERDLYLIASLDEPSALGDAVTRIEGPAEGGEFDGLFGADMDGDGLEDVVWSGVEAREVGATDGEVFVFTGELPPTGSADDATWALYGDPGDQLGGDVEIGDLDGDGYPELAAPVPSASGATALITDPRDAEAGRSAIRESSIALYPVPGDDSEYPSQVSVLSDLDGDGSDELMVLSGFLHTGYVFHGPISAPRDLAEADIEIDYVYSYSLADVRTLDHDGDGVLDLLTRRHLDEPTEDYYPTLLLGSL